MTTKQELHQAIDRLNDEQVRKLIRVVEVIQSELLEKHKEVDLTRYSGIVQFGEDALAYQQRIRSEWP